MDIIDVKTYMQSIGREARAASRLVAKAETAAKNRALTQMAAAIQRDEQMLLAANAEDVESARKRGLEPAMIDRLTLSLQKHCEAWPKVCCKSRRWPIPSGKSVT